MITKDTAVNARHGRTFYHGVARNADKSPLRCRVNGKCQTWKTRPDAFKLPVKYGLRDCFYITELNANEWFLTEEEASASHE